MKIVTVGDSITFDYVPGYGPSYTDTYKKPWPAFSLEDLEALYPLESFTLINEGEPGTTTTDWLGWITSKINVHNPDVVVILLGMNDASGPTDPAVSYEANLKTIISGIQAYNANTQIILVTTTQVRDTQPATLRTNTSLGMYADIVRSIGAELNLIVSDAYAVFDALIAEPEHTNLFVSDGVHLADTGVALLYPVIYSDIENTVGIASGLKMYTSMSSLLSVVYSVYEGKVFSKDGINYYRGVSDGDSVSVASIGLTSYPQQ